MMMMMPVLMIAVLLILVTDENNHGSNNHDSFVGSSNDMLVFDICGDWGEDVGIQYLWLFVICGD